MRCPFCGNEDTQVARDPRIRRRRRDPQAAPLHRTATSASPPTSALRLAMPVRRQEGRQHAAEFDRSPRCAVVDVRWRCASGPVSTDQVDAALIERIEEKMLATAAANEVPSDARSARLVMRELKKHRQGRLRPLCFGVPERSKDVDEFQPPDQGHLTLLPRTGRTRPGRALRRTGLQAQSRDARPGVDF